MSKEENINHDGAPMTPPLVPKKRKKKKWPFMILFLLIIGGVIFFFRKPILNKLSQIPVVGNFIPVQETSAEENLSADELRVKANIQQQEIEKLTAEIETLKNTNEALTEKNKSLAQYETMYTDFTNQKAAWDEAVARTNPELFIEQFESIYPEVAERIYQGLKGEKILSDHQKKLSTTIGQMDEAQAAAALELLISTDSELIQSIFEGMNTDRKAMILSEMSSEGAAQVIKLISPDK